MTIQQDQRGRGDSPILSEMLSRYRSAREALSPLGPAPSDKPRRFIYLTHGSHSDPTLPVAMPRMLPAGRPKAPKRRDIITLGVDVVHPLPTARAWRLIVSEVCLKHGVDWIDLCSDRRSAPLVAARHEAAYRLRRETTMSLPQIGRKLGGRDHTTILYGVRRHEAKLRGEVHRQPLCGKAREAAGL